ncbi:M4 family metallopeptidase [Niabella soli]|uniref:Neutral metalloproteinase n=1 Tax=Niabella soli DSM 19437 TaxID=929713 RepID=W0EZ91_9BACT|nr:M4 family metallopeptidase [Niabella soli]AHF14406.1 peptidase M4 [Niabella soli DSM 19437]
MCQSKQHFHSEHCIIPPYMRVKLMEAYDEGKEATTFAAQANQFTIDETLRGRRIAFSKLSNKARMAIAKKGFRKKQAATRPYREVYTSSNQERLPGKLVRKEGAASSTDQDVNRAYDGAGYTWTFYFSHFGRNSIDNEGMKLIQSVHYGKSYQNAFWDGKQMVYGDGDGKIFASFTSDIDVIGHELTHGVQQYETNLEYRDQSGALNESLADVFGIMIKQYALKQDAKTSDWLIGENTLIGEQYAIRSMKAPGEAYRNHPQLGSDPQPAHMKDYTDDPMDNGGVHLNSGIPNHAFYLAAYNVGGYAWEKVGMVWYKAMTNKELVPPNATFEQFKEATINTSGILFGKDNSVTKEIADAWKNVGV